MKIKISILLFILSLSINTKAQNLVYNGYFEINDTCPLKQLSQNYNQQVRYVINWFVSGGNPDYWNVCSNGVPSNTMGYQQDCCGGGGYIGMYVICSESSPGDDSAREYIGTKLIDTLKAGHKYLASMYVNRSNEWNYSIATMGMLFTDTAAVLPNLGAGLIFHANPQVRNNVPLTDTANWVLIQDTITAVGGEIYLTIGNFNTTATSDTVKSPGGFGTWEAFGSAYYYIDGVSVYDVAMLGIEQVKSSLQINIYPNPVSNIIHIETKEMEGIKLYDLLGNEILSTKENEIDMSNLTNGVYFIKASTKENSLTQKIIIQH